MVRGLIVGKFYPPHAGHDFLIRTARAQVDELVVVVCDVAGEDPPAVLRAEWLGSSHPDCDVRVVPDIGDDENSARWAQYTREFLGYTPHVVFTSEDYGDAYAAELGCTHVCVDRERHTVPVSGTEVRAAPARHWALLAPSVRAGMTRRIAVVGAESTGTTTLTTMLAERYRTVWVPEFGRKRTIEKMDVGDLEWTSEEFPEIARTQQHMEDEAAREAGPLLFCDTDALATTVWHERYFDRFSADVEAIAASRTYTAYILTGCEISFVQDGVRDGEHIRAVMTERLRTRLEARPEPWIEVHGDPETRLAAASAFVEQVVGPEWVPERA